MERILALIEPIVTMEPRERPAIIYPMSNE
jgi:hypothetical protein